MLCIRGPGGVVPGGRRGGKPDLGGPPPQRGRPKKVPQTTPPPDKASQSHHAEGSAKAGAEATSADAHAVASHVHIIPVDERLVLNEVVPTIIPPSPSAPLQAAVDKLDAAVPDAAENFEPETQNDEMQTPTPAPQPAAQDSKREHDNTNEQMHALAVGVGAGVAVLLALRLFHVPSS